MTALSIYFMGVIVAFFSMMLMNYTIATNDPYYRTPIRHGLFASLFSWVVVIAVMFMFVQHYTKDSYFFHIVANLFENKRGNNG